MTVMRSVNKLDSEKVIRSVPVDVRGWEVRTAVDDEKVGSVHDVLVDTSGAARYLDVDLGIFRKHVLLPIGQAVADADANVLRVHAMGRNDFEDVPEYDHEAGAVTPEFEQRLIGSYDRASGARRYQRTEYGGSGPIAVSGDPTVMGTEDTRLRRLSELDDYEVADDDPDPRGWQIVDASGERIGEVDDLVVDPQAMKTRYLEVDLRHDVIGDEDADHMLVPVGFARLDEDNKRVRVDALSESDVRTLPRYAKDFDHTYEDRVDRHFQSGFQGDRRYGHPRYDADRLYGARGIGSDREARGAGRICDVNVRR